MVVDTDSPIDDAGPLVTAVIPSYRHAKYVGEAIEGLLNQTYSNIELIIIDDASPDSSDAVITGYLERCEARFSKFTYVRKLKGKGLCDSLNRALEMASGEYFYMNGSDDVAKPEAIETLVGFIHDKPDYALVTGDCELIDSAGVRCYWGPKQEMLYDPAEATYVLLSDILKSMANGLAFVDGKFGSYKYLLFGNHVPNGHLQRISALREVGGYDETFLLEDWPTNLHLAKNYKMKFIDAVLFSYRWHATNTMRRDLAVSYSNWRVLRREKPYALSHGYTDFWRLSYRKVSERLYKNLRHWLITINTGKRRRQIRLFGFYILKPPR